MGDPSDKVMCEARSEGSRRVTIQYLRENAPGKWEVQRTQRRSMPGVLEE